MRGLYAHVPFCVRKCSYCDFYSVVATGGTRQAYVDAIVRESSAHKGEAFQTVYLGGGTPSILGPELLAELITGLRQHLDLSGVFEATIEVNPDTATPGFLRTASALGFNRVSVGVQSLCDDELKSVGRVHGAEQAVAAIKTAKQLGFKSVSADLIAGLPGQTWTSLRLSLEILLDLGIRHLSLYCLSVEEGTPIAQHIPDDLPSDDEQAELFTRASAILSSSGLSHYEISNFAKPGYECLHNMNYWRGGEYLGLGPAAASHLNGMRFRNKPEIHSYLVDSRSQMESVEKLGTASKASEEAMLRLRLLEEGLDIKLLGEKYHIDKIGALPQRLDRMSREGKLTREGSTYRLSPERVLTSNAIFAEVLSD